MYYRGASVLAGIEAPPCLVVGGQGLMPCGPTVCGLGPVEQREASRNTDQLSHARSARHPPIEVSAPEVRPSPEARSSEADTAMNGAGHGNRTHVLSLEG